MNEAAAQGWLVSEFDVPRETMARLISFVELVRRESESHNLISAATSSAIWSRHIVDSAQLLRFAPSSQASWLDLGTGAGFPGLIIALLHEGPVTVVEQRKLRINFLIRAAEVLGVEERTTIICGNAGQLAMGPFDVISARAFAPLARLLTLAAHFAAPQTRWVLPKGRRAKSELDAIESSWQGRFHLEPSITDPEARIIVAEGVHRKAKGKRGR